MRQLTEHDIDQVKALLDVMIQGLKVQEDMARGLRGRLEGILGRMDEWLSGGELVSGVAERKDWGTYEIWFPERLVPTHGGTGGYLTPVHMEGCFKGRDFQHAVYGWVHASVDNFLLWGDPEELNGHVCLAGIPVFPTREEAENYNKENKK